MSSDSATEAKLQQEAQAASADAGANADAGSEAQEEQQQQQSAADQQQQGFQSVSLYVGDLHPDVTESLLFEIFNAVGTVASIRVCRDAVTRRSLGYAYVNFQNSGDAERALDTMNYTLIKDRPCRIMWSQRDPSLRKTGAGNVFVKNLDLSIDNKALYDTFSLFGNILSCKVVTDREGNSQGYGFVHFETLKAAQEAIRKINGMHIAGKEVYVGHFQKRSERPGASEWTNLYVKNVPKHWDDMRLEKYFAEVGPVSSCVIMKDAEGKSKGFGFVDYAEHKDAVAAIEKFHELEVAADEDSEKLPADAPKEDVDAKKDEEPKEGEEVDEEAKKNIRRTTRFYVTRAQKKAERDRELSEKFEQIKQDRQSKYQGVNVYIKNLHESVTDEDLHDAFSKFGSITSVRVMREPLEDSKEEDGEETDDKKDEEPKEEDAAEKEADKKDEEPKEEDAAEKEEDETEEGEEGDKKSKKKLGASKGFGFVCFADPESSLKAITEMQGRMLKGKPIFVALAQRKESRRAELEAQHRRMPRGMPGMQQMYPNPMMPYGVPGGMPVPPGGMPGMPPGAMPPQARGYGPGYMPIMIPPRGMPGRGMPQYPGMPQNMPPQGMQPGMPQNMPPQGMPQGMQQGMGNMQMGRGGSRGGRGGRGGGRGGKNGAPQQQGANFKYNANVRNQPGAPQQNMGQMQQQMPMGMPMQGGPEPLTAAALASASEKEQKNMIGERLYPLIVREQPQLASKITGMLLEMDNPELLHLLESPDSLEAKIQEALRVLRQAKEKAEQQ